MMLTFDEARRSVAASWPDYRVAPYGYETPTEWLLILLPETAGGRIPVVSKANGTIRWINENSDAYTQRHPVGKFPAGRP
jgi:hypothetical protein